MLASPSLKDLPRYPVTAGVALAAVVVTGMWWSGTSIDAFEMNGRVWADGELWRALTCTLPHVNVFHLAFNLYWLWKFGALVERVYGHLKCAGIYLLLALGSSLAQFTVSYGGVGLSGVGYGLWGLLWVLERRDVRFTGAVDRPTSQLFVVWFFLCIVLTITGVMQVANVAHGAGAGLGALLGLAASSRGALKWRSVAGLAAALMLGLAGSTVFWPWTSQSRYAEPAVEQAALEALDRDDAVRGAKLLEIATRMRDAPARTWFNLGVAYFRLQRFDDALAAYEHAAQMPDADADMRQAAKDMKVYVRQIHSTLQWAQEHATNGVPVFPEAITNR